MTKKINQLIILIDNFEYLFFISFYRTLFMRQIALDAFQHQFKVLHDNFIVSKSREECGQKLNSKFGYNLKFYKYTSFVSYFESGVRHFSI